jgi:hypothetical protein
MYSAEVGSSKPNNMPSIPLRTPSKWKTYGFAIATIVGIGGLAVCGVGVVGYFHVGALSNMAQVDAIIMMAVSGGIGAILLISGIVGTVKNRMIPPVRCFGPEEWKKHFGVKVIAPPLGNIAKILNCRLIYLDEKNDRAGLTVQETHCGLMLMPETLFGKPLKECSHLDIQKLRNKKNESTEIQGRWVLIRSMCPTCRTPGNKDMWIYDKGNRELKEQNANTQPYGARAREEVEAVIAVEAARLVPETFWEGVPKGDDNYIVDIGLLSDDGRTLTYEFYCLY